MSGQPVRLAIASSNQIVSQGLRSMLADHAERVVVVDHRDESELPDVVIHDRLDPAEPVAWVSAGADVAEILRMIEAAAAGELEPSGPLAALTPRELEVLRLIARGLSNQEIADQVFVSINSVKTYIRSAYRKIGVRSRTQAVAWCLQNDLG